MTGTVEKLRNSLSVSKPSIRVIRNKIESDYKSFRRPRTPIFSCQSINLALVHGQCIITQDEDEACVYAPVFLGFISKDDVPQAFDGSRDGGWGRATKEAYARSLSLVATIPVGTAFVAYAPLWKVEELGLDYRCTLDLLQSRSSNAIATCKNVVER